MKKIAAIIALCCISPTINAQVGDMYHHRDLSTDHSNFVPKDKIKKDCMFFGADSLAGFPLEAEIDLAIKRHPYYSELTVTLKEKEIAFIKAKYHISKLPFETGSQRNSLPHNTPLSAGCVNLGFDDSNDFAGWTGYTGYNANSNAPLTIVKGPTTPAVTPVVINSGEYSCDYFSIVKPATLPTDPLCNFSLVSPLGGNVAKLGGEYRNLGGVCDNPPTDPTPSPTNTAGEVLERKFVVTNSNTEFQYCFAFVYHDDSSHTNGQQPYFKVEVLDQGGNQINCLNYYQQGNDGVAPANYKSIPAPYATAANDKIYFTNGFQISSLNLLPYLTQTVTVRFTVAGCNQTAHCGYA